MTRALSFVFIISTFLVGFGVWFWVLFGFGGVFFHKKRLFKNNRQRMVAKSIFYITIIIYFLLNDYWGITQEIEKLHLKFPQAFFHLSWEAVGLDEVSFCT